MNLEELGHYDGRYRGLEVPQCGTRHGTHLCAVERWITHIGPGKDAISTFRRLGYRAEGNLLFTAHGFYTVEATTAEDAFKIVRFVEQLAVREIDPVGEVRNALNNHVDRMVVTPDRVVLSVDDCEIMATHESVFRHQYIQKRNLCTVNS